MDRKVSLRLWYTVLGALLGLGAPAGALLLHLPHVLQSGWWTDASAAWHRDLFFYAYMAAGTIIAFSLFGYVLGSYADELKRWTLIDGLTGLFNHSYLQERLREELDRARRYHQPVTALMIDIDDFKKINDTFGHQFGDRVLATIAHRLHGALRSTDVLGRYGGEEFLALLPQTSFSVAQPMAERINQIIASEPFASVVGPLYFTVSIGLSCYGGEATILIDSGTLINMADEALYQAKRSGKNRTVVWAKP